MARHVTITLLDKRTESAGKVQEILTKYGCYIKCRLGLHDVRENCEEEGLIILELSSKESAGKIESELSSITGVQVQTVHMSF